MEQALWKAFFQYLLPSSGPAAPARRPHRHQTHHLPSQHPACNDLQRLGCLDTNIRWYSPADKAPLHTKPGSITAQQARAVAQLDVPCAQNGRTGGIHSQYGSQVVHKKLLGVAVMWGIKKSVFLFCHVAHLVWISTAAPVIVSQTLRHCTSTHHCQSLSQCAWSMLATCATSSSISRPQCRPIGLHASAADWEPKALAIQELDLLQYSRTCTTFTFAPSFSCCMQPGCQDFTPCFCGDVRPTSFSVCPLTHAAIFALAQGRPHS